MALFTKKLITVFSYALLYFSCFIAQASSKGNPLLDTFLSEDDANAAFASMENQLAIASPNKQKEAADNTPLHNTSLPSTTIASNSIAYADKTKNSKRTHTYKKCTLCDVTMRSSRIRSHMRAIHLGQTFSCHYCSFTMPAIALDLLEHLRGSHDFEGTICAGCGVPFSDKNARNIHKKICPLSIPNYKRLDDIIKKHTILTASNDDKKIKK